MNYKPLIVGENLSKLCLDSVARPNLFKYSSIPEK